MIRIPANKATNHLGDIIFELFQSQWDLPNVNCQIQHMRHIRRLTKSLMAAKWLPPELH